MCKNKEERQIFLNYCKTQLEVTKMSLLREEMYTCVQNFFIELTKLKRKGLHEMLSWFKILATMKAKGFLLFTSLQQHKLA